MVKKKGRYPVLLLAAGILCTGLLIHTYPPGWGGVVRAAVREQAERRRRQREQSVEQERPMTDCSCWHFTGMAPSRSIHMKASDTLAGEQWALSNDGTFQMEDEQNRFPVFDRPFTQPSAPGHWQRPQQGMSGSAPWGTSGNMPSGTPQNTFPGVRGITPGKMDPAGTLGQAFAGYPGHGIISAASADAEAGAVAGIDINVEEAWDLYGKGTGRW